MQRIRYSMFGEKINYLDAVSSNFETLKLQFGYYNHHLFSETDRFFENEINSHTKHLTYYDH
jgi:hypothetical protein